MLDDGLKDGMRHKGGEWREEGISKPLFKESLEKLWSRGVFPNVLLIMFTEYLEY